MEKVKTIITFILLFSYCSQAENFRHINVEDGQSSRYVSLISKDSTGFMWFYSSLGIDRFDGSEIRHYSLQTDPALKEQRNPPSIRSCDASGNIWIALKSGEIYAYDKKIDSYRCRFDVKDYLEDFSEIQYFYMDKENRFWFMISSVLYLLKEEKLSPIAELPEQIRVMRQTGDNLFYIGTLTSLYQLNTDFRTKTRPIKVPFSENIRVETLHVTEGNLFVGTFSQSVYTIHLSSGEIKSLSALIPSRPIRTITSTQDKKVLVGTDGAGLYCLDAKTMRLIERYTAQENKTNSLSSNTVTTLFVDDYDRIWISTYTNGISVLDLDFPDIHRVKHESFNVNSLISNHVNTVIEDSDGDVWYGTDNGVSLYRIKEKKWEHFLNDKEGKAQSATVILTLCEDIQKRMWVGGFGTGTWLVNKRNGSVQKIKKRKPNENTGVSTDYVYSIYADKENVWFGGIEGELTQYNLKEDKYIYHPIECIGDLKAGKKNDLLIASCDGLVIFNKENGEINRHNTFGNTLIQYPIRCLLQTSTEDIWMATSGNGLIRFNPETGNSKIFNIDNGLSSNAVTSLTEDHKGYLWFSSGADLYRIDLQTEVISEMDELISLEGAFYSQNAFYTQKDGQLILGTVSGTVEFMPDFLPQKKSSPKLLFTDFELLYKLIQADEKDSPLDKAINETSSIRLKSSQKYFSLSFSAINYKDPHQTGYMYMLDGFDPDWRQATSEQTASYTNVPSGNYHFQLKAINKYTKEVLDERTLDISISKPVWASFGAWLVYLVLAAGLAFFVIQYIRNRIEKHNSKEKIKFFIDVAHDIRIPVSLIKAPLSELEEQETLSVRGKKSLTTAIHNVDKLFGMVTQLLELQKADLPTNTINLTKHNLYFYLQEKITAFRMAATQKGLTLTLEADSELPDIWFDQGDMDKIIDNLLSNAIKYTEKGSVQVIVNQQPDKWSIEVKDTGIGIPSHDQKHLFKEFYRAGNAVNSKESGSGIGLVLIRKLVKLHKGQITYSSAENVGSSFIVTFPTFAELLNPTEETNRDEKPRMNPSQEKELLLLAEDDDEMRDFLTESLSQEYRVVSFSDGKVALEQAKELNPDIVISDIILPTMRGYDICRELKSSMETSHIPVILLTALNEKENIIMGLEAGADDYIIKPFDSMVLKARIRNVLQTREKLRKMILSAETGLEEINYSNQLDKEFLDKAIELIEAELSNPEFSINDFCRALGMSRTSAYNKIKTLTNQGPNDFIRIIRLNKARELLKSKRYSIGEVSVMVGFSDPKYFSTSFKKQFGISPSKVE